VRVKQKFAFDKDLRRLYALDPFAAIRQSPHAVQMSNPSVLIIDPSEETREVLRTALESRGIRTLAASRPRQGLALALEHHPDLIVLDLEFDHELAGGGEVTLAESWTGGAPLVMLGSVRRRRAHMPPGPFISKPYHYGPLIRKIEELLAAGRQPAAAAG
jgi:CheY-like chemotaxis protein